MGIRKYTWVKFINYKWVRDYHLTPGKPYRVQGVNGLSTLVIYNDNKAQLQIPMSNAIKCTPAESRLAILLE